MPRTKGRPSRSIQFTIDQLIEASPIRKRRRSDPALFTDGRSPLSVHAVDHFLTAQQNDFVMLQQGVEKSADERHLFLLGQCTISVKMLNFLSSEAVETGRQLNGRYVRLRLWFNKKSSDLQPLLLHISIVMNSKTAHAMAVGSSVCSRLQAILQYCAQNPCVSFVLLEGQLNLLLSNSNEEHDILCALYLTKHAFPDMLTPASIPSLSGGQRTAIKQCHIFHSLWPHQVPLLLHLSSECEPKQRHSLNQFFADVRQAQKSYRVLESSHFPDPQHKNLKVQLRGYQCEAVRWMHHRETTLESHRDIFGELYCSLKDANGKCFWFSSHHGGCMLNLPEVTADMQELRGGLLADEMGLGKTLELLSLILIHPRPLLSNVNSNPPDLMNEDGFVLRPVPTTLVVLPPVLLTQWRDEVRKHTSGLRMRIYRGTILCEEELLPEHLDNTDLLLTTYSVVAKETRKCTLNSSRPRRQKFPASQCTKPSVLTQVQFWRIILDEAQVVHRSSSQLSELIGSLFSKNRWCVTGTPVQRGLHELHGLLAFLCAQPYWHHGWFHRLLWYPLCCEDNSGPLVDVMKQYMWRTSKLDVVDQLGLPSLSYVFHKLNFTPLERYVYESCQQDIAPEALASFADLSADIILYDIARDQLEKRLLPINLLRQGCCHPARHSTTSVQRSTRMADVLSDAVQREINKGSESHRLWIMSNNALAVLEALDGSLNQAIMRYRETLSESKRVKGLGLTVDVVQRVHVCFNLKRLLPEDSIERVQLESMEARLRAQELTRQTRFVDAARQRWDKMQPDLRDLFESEVCNTWWPSAALRLEQEDLDIVLATLEGKPSLNQVTRFLNGACSSGDRLVFLLELAMKEQRQKRSEAHQILHFLDAHKNVQENSILENFISCCRNTLYEDDFGLSMRKSASSSSSGFRRENCSFCQALRALNDYGDTIFMSRRSQASEVMQNKRVAGGQELVERAEPGAVQLILARLLDVCSQRNWNCEWIASARRHCQLLELAQKEFFSMRKFWVELNHLYCCLDSLQKACLTFQIEGIDCGKLSNSTFNTVARLTLQRHEIEPLRIESLQQCHSAMINRQCHLDRLQYLRNIERQRLEQHCEQLLCPVCREDSLSKPDWQMLTCGHHCCLDCYRTLLDTSQRWRQFLRCPQCRAKSLISEHRLVLTKGVPNDSLTQQCTAAEESSVCIGDHSSKVSAVVRLLMDIQNTEINAKALIFSSWVWLLRCLQKALKENHIRHVTFLETRAATNLDVFREPAAASTEIQVLLLPVHLGAHGLNLTEANHVLFMEPLLNTGQTMQAISRVHRIGQLRPVVVHYFLVRDTLEERLADVLSNDHFDIDSNNMDSNYSSLTVGTLRQILSCVSSVQIESLNL